MDALIVIAYGGKCKVRGFGIKRVVAKEKTLLFYVFDLPVTNKLNVFFKANLLNTKRNIIIIEK